MANYTYIYFGINELDVTELSSVARRSVAEKIGQITVGAVGARDGTWGYDATNQTAAGWSNYDQKGALFLAVDKLYKYSSMHMADLELEVIRRPPRAPDDAVKRP